MKKNKIFIALAVGIGAYLLWNMKKNKSTSPPVTPEPEYSPSFFVKTGGKKLSDEEVFRGINDFTKSTRMQNKQYVRVPTPNILLGKPNPKSLEYLQKGEDFEVENSRGERKKVLGYSHVGVILDVPITDAGQGGWLEKGETFKLLKV